MCKYQDKCGECRCFGSRRHESGNSRWRALIDVGDPHMKRNSSHLEGKPYHEQTDSDPEILRSFHLGEMIDEIGDAGSSCRSIDERDPVKEEACGKCPQEKILERGFIRDTPFSHESRENVKADRHQLEAKKDNNKVGRRGHQHHPERRKEDQQVEFSQVRVLRYQIVAREENREKG